MAHSRAVTIGDELNGSHPSVLHVYSVSDYMLFTTNADWLKTYREVAAIYFVAFGSPTPFGVGTYPAHDAYQDNYAGRGIMGQVAIGYLYTDGSSTISPSSAPRTSYHAASWAWSDWVGRGSGESFTNRTASQEYHKS